LNKPEWNPPSYIFGPVWTGLYFLMGIAWWLVVQSDVLSHKKKKAQVYFIIQLFLNFWWSILFFRLHSPLWAFVDIILLIVAISLTIFSFARISRIAAWLLVPYISWVCFAAFLNYSIWALNP
jgi:benzodiazapine receptor